MIATRHFIQGLECQRGWGFVVFCFGVLYHLRHPTVAIEFLSKQSTEFLLLETCVSFGERNEVNQIEEDPANPTQARNGLGCRPTRSWVFDQLSQYFEHVYVPRTQPWHVEFPLDWTLTNNPRSRLSREVFIGSRLCLNNSILLDDLPGRQVRH